MGFEENTAEKSVKELKYYVGVGASAGGLEALELFFSNMMRNSGMAFIVIQHLSPDYKSLMVELLSKRTTLDVKRAEDNMEVLADTVYLIPPKKNLRIFHGKLLLEDSDHSKGINLPIDLFFKSLADDRGDKSIGVILSGTGSDGVRGIRSIKEAGGMVLVQSEQSAKFDGMPKSAIATGLVDIILPPEEMPNKLRSYIDYPYLLKSIKDTVHPDEDGYTRIFSLLRDKTNVDFTFYKPSTVLRRIERRMSVNQVLDIKEYVFLLERQPGEIVTLFKELLIGVTNFFRDQEVFDELENIYIEKIFKNAAANNNDLRFWVAGCSTGEEAYSLAILCQEYMKKNNISINLKIFATDIDKDAIFYAGNGMYSESVAAEISPEILSQYFIKKEDKFQVDRSIREMVVFAQHNLLKDPPFTNIDFISCRNLLIYFQPVLQKKVLDFFNFSLKAQGILLLGTSESVGDMNDFFELLHPRFKIYQSRGRRQNGITELGFMIQTDSRSAVVRSSPITGAVRQEEERLIEKILHSFAGDYIPFAVVVNENYEVLHIIGDADKYFSLPSGKLTNNISKMASKEITIPLTTGLQKVFKTGEEIRYSNIRFTRNTETKFINMRIRPLPVKKGQLPVSVVIIEEAPVNSSDTRNEANNYDLSFEAEQRIKDLELELQFTRENPQATIEELETSNEELQATNEELLASNEELQSTNEELQSVNEELHTVNTEFQSKIIDLTEMTNDLENLLASTNIGTIFLDENLEIRKFNNEIKKVFNIVLRDIGRPIEHIKHNVIESFNPAELISDVEQTGEAKELKIKTISGSSYMLKIIPYQVSRDIFSGYVINTIDITNVLNTERALSNSEDRLTGLYRAVPAGVGIFKNRSFYEVSDKICEMLGYTRDELLNKSLSMVYENAEKFESIGNRVYPEIQNKGISTIQTKWRRRDGTYIPVLVSTTFLNKETNPDEFIFTVLELNGE